MDRYVREDELIADAIKSTRRSAREANRPTGTEKARTTEMAQDALDLAGDAAGSVDTVSRVPKVPTGLAVVSNVPGWGVSAEATVTLSWTAVTECVDGEPVEVSYELFDGDFPAWAGDTTTAVVKIVSGATHSCRVRAVTAHGVPGDLSVPVTVTGAVPPVAVCAPSVPILVSSLGVVVARWDGIYVPGDVVGAYTVRVEARVGTGAWVPQGAALTGAGDQAVTVGSTGDTVEVRLIAVDRLSRDAGTSDVSSVVVVGAVAGDVEMEPLFFDKLFGNEAMIGRIKTNHIDPAVGGQLNLSANESIVIIAGRQDQQDNDLAGVQEQVDIVEGEAAAAAQAAADAAAAASLADGKALVAQTQAQDASDRINLQQAVFRVTSTGADVASKDGSNVFRITPTGAAIVQAGAPASTWDGGRLIVSEAIVSRAQIGNHVAEKQGARTTFRPL